MSDLLEPEAVARAECGAPAACVAANQWGGGSAAVASHAASTTGIVAALATNNRVEMRDRVDAAAATHTVTLDLSHVSVDDQTLVRDVCAVLAVMRKDLHISNIEITASGQSYVITASFPFESAVEISKAELDTLMDVNPLRVVSASVLCGGGPARVPAQIRLRVCSMDYPISVTDTSIVKVVKKRRWWC